MTLARWKDLCVDATEPAVVGEYWASALSLELTMQDGGDAVLRGATPEETVWVNRVPEPKTVKNRVHLDLVRPPLDELLALGATVVHGMRQDGDPWTVLAGPEGEEFCSFPDTGAPTALVVDSADPESDARWWAAALGGQLLEAPGGLRRWVDVPGMPYEVMKFVGVADRKTVKNRVHWDVVSGDVAGLVGHGATVLRKEPGWHVLADPAGNEFCVMSP